MDLSHGPCSHVAKAAKAATDEVSDNLDSMLEAATKKLAMARSENKKLQEELRFKENEVCEREEVLAEAIVDQAMKDYERAQKGNDSVDEYLQSKTGEPRGGRQHSNQVRIAISKALALGLAPSQVVPMLRAGQVNFEGHEPKLDFVRRMRRELRVTIVTLAAAAAADPRASFCTSVRSYC